MKDGFLRALEESGSTDAANQRRQRSGWTSVYVLCERDRVLVGGVAAFVKAHSYGEYIFDWGWANAADRAGIEYYPKLVIAAPATPATGKRILLAAGAGGDVVTALIAGVRAIADDAECSSIHWLFCTRGRASIARRARLLRPARRCSSTGTTATTRRSMISSAR